MIITLNRLFTGPKGTFGKIAGTSFYTLELPWNNGDNHPDLSCILPGQYQAQLVMSPHFGFLVPRLQNVPGRTLIEQHPANFPSDLLGCIGIGAGIDILEGQTAIINSDVAFHDYMTMINGLSFAIQINNSF